MSYENTDINNLELRNEVVSYDPDAEFNPNLAVPDGNYLATLSHGKWGTGIKTSKAGKSYVQSSVQATIVAPGTKFDGFRISGRVSSLIMPNTNTGLLQQMLKSVGTPVPANSTLGQIEDLTNAALNSGAQCFVRTRWEASTKNSEGTTGPDQYLRIKGMRKFPQKADGSYDPNFTFTLADGSEVTTEARPEFSDFQPSASGAASN